MYCLIYLSKHAINNQVRKERDTEKDRQWLVRMDVLQFYYQLPGRLRGVKSHSWAGSWVPPVTSLTGIVVTSRCMASLIRRVSKQKIANQSVLVIIRTVLGKLYNEESECAYNCSRKRRGIGQGYICLLVDLPRNPIHHQLK